MSPFSVIVFSKSEASTLNRAMEMELDHKLRGVKAVDHNVFSVFHCCSHDDENVVIVLLQEIAYQRF